MGGRGARAPYTQRAVVCGRAFRWGVPEQKDTALDLAYSTRGALEVRRHKNTAPGDLSFQPESHQPRALVGGNSMSAISFPPFKILNFEFFNRF